jgi:putative addiction module antidote
MSRTKSFSEDPAKFKGAKATVGALKIRKIGNSAGVVLTKEMLGRLGVGVGDELQVIETSNGLELSPFDEGLEDALSWIEKGAKRYRNTLRALSK